MNTTAAVIYTGFFGAIAAIGVAVSLAGQPFLAFTTFIIGMFFLPRFKETPGTPTRAPTDAEAKAQMVDRLTTHLESEEHIDDCDELCPVPDILTKLAQ